MNQQMNIIQQNAQMRAALLATAPPMRKNLGAFSGGAAGGTTRVKLYNVGIITRLLMRVTATLTISTNTQTLSPMAPFNLISRVRLTDFDGTDRVNCTGYELFLINCRRYRGPYGYNNDAATAVINNPITPTLAAATKRIQFYLEVPLAYAPPYGPRDATPGGAPDLRGAILAQTALGEMYLNIDWLNTLGQNANAEGVYNTATAATDVAAPTDITVQVWQEFLLPQTLGGQVPLPQLDLLTVYELAGAIKSTDNIAANTEKLINFPNVRSVLALYMRYVENGVMVAGATYDAAGTAATTNMSQFRVIANGNNVLYDNTAEGHLFEQRLGYGSAGSDLRNASYIFDFSRKPVETSLYGNVQLGATPSSATATTFAPYMGICFESFYTKGATLPGMSQASG